MADSEWFYLLGDGRREGPVSTPELAGRLRSQLPPETLVWRAGMTDWQPASRVPEIGAVPPASPRTPRPPSLPAAGEEPHTLNPFRLFRRCFDLSGRFSRGQFAVLYLGSIVLVFAAAVALGIGGAIAGASEETIGVLSVVLGVCALPPMMVASIGGGIRRLHDLGKPGWYIVLTFLPCVNLIVLLYLLLAPTAAEPYAGGSDSGVAIAIAVGLVGVMLVGILAAIAIPSLLRARVAANEAATLGDLRALVSGQHAYAAANGGYFDAEWSCLARPAGCVPNYGGEPFITPELAVATKNGYVRELHPGGRFAPGTVPPGVSPSSTNAFAFVAYPAKASQTGVRAFCADASGRVCFAASGSAEGLVETLSSDPWVRCNATCQDLR